ncbi:MAG: ribose-5-phosphate isomerase RpiA [Rubrobacteraceae bacterium]
MPDSVDGFKSAAASEAVERYVESGMIVGLGTGSTALWVVKRIGALLASGELRDVKGVPTSRRTAEQARQEEIPLVDLSEARPALTIDGTDEVSPELNLIKGLGGALLREKIVAASGDGLIVVADESKLVETLGRGPLPLEVEPFGLESTIESISDLGCEPSLRIADGEPFVTDGGHYIVDCVFASIPDPATLEDEIKRIPGALETGLFVGICRAAVISSTGGTEVLER